MLESICVAFAEVIDTNLRSRTVIRTVWRKPRLRWRTQLGMKKTEVTLIRRAALLHDIGKLSVPNTILEKPGKLTEGEWTLGAEAPLLHAADSAADSGLCGTERCGGSAP